VLRCVPNPTQPSFEVSISQDEAKLETNALCDFGLIRLGNSSHRADDINWPMNPPRLPTRIKLLAADAIGKSFSDF
jgi:hypothetical protein